MRKKTEPQAQQHPNPSRAGASNKRLIAKGKNTSRSDREVCALDDRSHRTDKQWEILAPLLSELPRREDGRGRPWADSRKLLNGMLWVLRTGAQWQDLPSRYGTKPACHRRFQQWVDAGVFEQILKHLAEDLKQRGGLDLSECFADATFASAKKGDLALAPPVGAKAARSWQWQTALVFLSPSTLSLLRQQRSSLLKLYSSDALQMLSRSD